MLPDCNPDSRLSSEKLKNRPDGKTFVVRASSLNQSRPEARTTMKDDA